MMALVQLATVAVVVDFCCTMTSDVVVVAAGDVEEGLQNHRHRSLNTRGIPYPYFRYTVWNDVDQDIRLNTLADKLGYTQATWNTPGLADIELESWDSLIENHATTILPHIEDIGFTQDVWDCFINHYDGYLWDELPGIGGNVQQYWQTLGWNRLSWDNYSNSNGNNIQISAQERQLQQPPITNNQFWSQLTDEQRIAGTELCYTEGSWNQLSFNLWKELPKEPGVEEPEPTTDPPTRAATPAPTESPPRTTPSPTDSPPIATPAPTESPKTSEPTSFSTIRNTQRPTTIIDTPSSMPVTQTPVPSSVAEASSSATPPANTTNTGSSGEDGGSTDYNIVPTTSMPDKSTNFNNDSDVDIDFDFDIDSVRYMPWQLLSTYGELGPTKSNGETLGYTEINWNVLGTNQIESFNYEDVGYIGFGSIIRDIGFTTAQSWDCHINHYTGFTWKELDSNGYKIYWIRLGWTEDSWYTKTTPKSISLDWNDLSDSEQQAAIALCYRQEIWDGIPLTEWESTSSAVQDSSSSSSGSTILVTTIFARSTFLSSVISVLLSLLLCFHQP